ncbi:MAG: OmpH family outer membrane protein [Cyclobacteriaceae bacterium]
MKSRILLSTALTIVGLGLMAQLKIGYTNADYILSLMPEAKQIESDLTAYETQLQNQLKSKYDEFQTKAGDYQQNGATMIDAVRADKEAELQRMQGEIQAFEQQAQQSLANKRNQLISPAYEKIGTAIEQVSLENGYTHVFSSGSPGLSVLLYAREEDNISDLILKKLGIDPPADSGN